MKTSFLPYLVLLFLHIDNGNSEPHFTIEPKDFIGFEDKFSRLIASVSGAVNPTYQWYHNRSKVTSEVAFTLNSPAMFFKETNLSSQGIYQLFVSSKLGRIFGREIKVEYIIVGEFFNKTTTIKNVVIGQQFEIDCPAHGLTQHAFYKWGGTAGGPTGTWFFTDRPNVLVLGDGRLFFSHVTKEDVEYLDRKGGISCILEATYAGYFRLQESGVFKLNVTGEQTQSFGPKLEKIPDEEVVEGESMLLRCIAAAYPTPTYRWTMTNRKGKTENITDKVNGVELSEGNKFLTIKNVKKDRYAGTYTCYATVQDGGESRTANESSEVTVRVKLTWVAGTHIKSATPDIYSEHSWTCMAKGDPEPEYYWYANATIMKNTSGRHTIEGGILTFHRVSPEDNGMYQCVAKNKFGFAYQTVSLIVKVQAPEITTAISQKNFVAGNTGVISCVSNALPPAKHHWLFKGVMIEPNKTEKYDLTAQNDLVVHRLSQDDTGNYTCVATNTYGKATREKYIKVAEIMFKRRPENNTNVARDTSFKLFCEAESDPPLNIRYKWLFEAQELQLSDANHKWNVSSHTLTVSNAQGHESGVYECIAYSETSNKSSAATVIVRGRPDPPVNLTLHGACANLSANLTWVFRYRSSYEPLTRILIQWSTPRDTGTWYNFSDQVQGSANGHVIKGLNPYSDIVFRVIAVNVHGRGNPSNVTTGQECKTPAEEPTVCPANVKGHSTQPREIKVTWEEVQRLNQNGPGFGYVVRFRKPGSTWNVKHIPHGNEQRFATLNTSANELWEFQVQSYNDEGTGPECPISQAKSVMEATIIFKVRPENNTHAQKGGNFSLSCEASSDPPLPVNYKWLHEGKELNESGMTYTWTMSNKVLTVFDSRLEDGGKYECVAYVKTPVYNAQSRASSEVIVRGKPDAPRDLTLGGKCSNFSANLTWKIGYRNPYEPLTKILIQLRTSRGNGMWSDVADHVQGSANSHVVRGLNPYSDIVFQVIAVNVRGNSEPSDSTSGQECKTQAAKPTVCPTDVQGSAKIPLTIEITWKAVPLLYQNGPDFAYIVSYRRPGSQWQREVIQGSQRYTISNAGSYKLWEFKVQSKNALGNGSECKVHQARSAKQVPKSVPQSLRYKEIGANYVILEWQPIDSSGIDGYQLSYWYKNTETRVRRAKNVCNDEKNPCTTKIKNVTTREYKQQNLLPFKDYTMFLQAYNAEGLGPKSTPLTLTTKEGRPGPPDHVKFTEYGRYIDMRWKPPKEKNGIIVGYVLGIENTTNITVDGYTMAHLFAGLKPAQEYVVYIYAKTSAGMGDTVSKMVSTTEMRVPAISKPPYVLAVDEDSVNVTYNPSTKTEGFPEKFCVVYKEEGQSDEDMKKTNATLIKRDGGKSYIVIRGLDNTKRYLFATIVMNGDKESKRSGFTPGQPIMIAEVSEDTPIYRKFWFYIILGVVLLLLLILPLLLFLRRKPKRVYKVGEREKKHAVNGSIEMGEKHPLKDAEFTEDQPQGKADFPEEATLPATSNKPTLSSDHNSRDSLDEYEGEDDDFSEHGSFIGQYGNGEKAVWNVEKSSSPSYV